MEELQHYLPYLIPPVLGGIIGYVTNHVAIRMLFRPLKAWRILGLRVPLTPGIIPSKRGELAIKMGEMVGDHLLTADDVGRAFAKKSIQRELRLTVADKISEILDRPLGPLETLVPSRFRDRFREVISLLQVKTVKIVFGYLQTDAFEEKLRSYLVKHGDKLLARDLNSYLTPERKLQLQQQLDEKFSQLLESHQTAEFVRGFIDRKTEQLLSSDKTLRELLPQDLLDALLEQVEKELPPLVEKFGGMLYDPEFRQQLVAKGKQAIDSFLDSLGGLAGLLSGFIDLNKIYDKIPDFLDQAGEQISEWLREEKTQQQLTLFLRERIDHFLDRPLSGFVENLSYDKVSGIKQFVREQALTTLQSRKTIDTAIKLAENTIDRIKDRTFSELLQEILPSGGLDHGREQLLKKLLEVLRSAETRTAFEGVLVEQSELWIYHKPLGLLSARLPADVRLELESGSCQLVEEMLKKEAPRLVETLNVRRMVEEKVNSLDLLQVEGLLMGVMKEQFKYINLFGALLGFIIGCFNLLFLSLI
jgi:uncharacterized membrane protein YheB (UPF0754 family)